MNWIDINKQQPLGNKKVLTFSPDLEEAQYRLLNPANFKTFPDQVKYWCEIPPPNFIQQTKCAINNLLESQKDLDIDVVESVNENFSKLI